MMVLLGVWLLPTDGQASAPRPVPDRVARIGQVIPVPAEDATAELHLLSFAQTADDAWITMAARNHGGSDPLAPVLDPSPAAPVRPFTAIDDTGTRYRLRFPAKPLPDSSTQLGSLHRERPHGIEEFGDVVGALQAAGELSPCSPVPGQLAALCASLDLDGHGHAPGPRRRADRDPRPAHQRGRYDHAPR